MRPPHEKENGDGTSRLGLLGIRERVQLLGGTLEIESAPGRGTTLFAHIPIDGYAGGRVSSTTAPESERPHG